MGSKYTTQAASGYNSSPPADDGSQTASNLVKWSNHKTKLADPIKTLADNINSALVTALDYSVRQITSSDSVAATDHMKTVEFAPTATSGLTLTLADAATMTNNFIVRVKNSSSHEQTIGRATTSDTIEGSAADITIPSKASFILSTTTGADGFLILSAYRSKQPTRQVLTSGTAATYTTPTGATRINVRMVGGGAGGAGSGTSPGAATDATSTTFSTLTAGGGAKGSAAAGGGGGASSGGDINITGQDGTDGVQANASTSDRFPGGNGGSTLFGGGGTGQQNAAGRAAYANTGGGGAGGGIFTANLSCGGGGGAGGYCEKLITAPSATYSYTVGAAGTGGTAGTSGFAGGNGAAGLIIVDEFYD